MRAGPSAHTEAQKAMRRLATAVDERRNPRTNATVGQLLDRHFELAELEVNTQYADDDYRDYVKPFGWCGVDPGHAGRSVAIIL
jgi:integrase